MAKQKLSLGESLVQEGLITAPELKQAQDTEKHAGKPLRKILVEMQLISEEDLVAFLCNQSGLPRIELNNYLIDPKIIELVPEELAKKYELIPVLKIGNRLTCAMIDPWNIFALDEVRLKTKMIIEPSLATESEIKAALNAHYGAKGTMDELIKSIDDTKVGFKKGEEIDDKKLEDVVKEPVVIKLVNLIVMKALAQGASDIHIEPEEDILRIRFRVDGILYEESSPPKHLQSAIISRIKILANLDITERRVPQDGRFNIKMDGKEIDVRVSCMPMIYGENIVLRLFNVQHSFLSLRQSGLSAEVSEKYQKFILRPHGIILVAGPTGSGKTTTLYATLKEINTIGKNIVTIEDPVEYRLPGIRQIQISPKVGLSFATGLKSILRQDPDVIMVGEIRDLETAQIAIQAALTGHLVFSTLHTNGAVGVIPRLIDMGVDPYLIAPTLILAMAQRLTLGLYPGTGTAIPIEGSIKVMIDKQFSDLPKKYLDEIDFTDNVYNPQETSECPSGTRGRVAVIEVFEMDKDIESAILKNASELELTKVVRAKGMLTMKEDAIVKTMHKIIPFEEVNLL